MPKTHSALATRRHCTVFFRPCCGKAEDRNRGRLSALQTSSIPAARSAVSTWRSASRSASDEGLSAKVVAQDWDGIHSGPACQEVRHDHRLDVHHRGAQEAGAFSNPITRRDDPCGTKGAGHQRLQQRGAQGQGDRRPGRTTQAGLYRRRLPDAEIKLYPTRTEANLDHGQRQARPAVRRHAAAARLVTKNDDGKGCCELIGEPITDKNSWATASALLSVREDDELRERLNKALDEIRADGTYKKINDKYFHHRRLYYEGDGACLPSGLPAG